MIETLLRSRRIVAAPKQPTVLDVALGPANLRGIYIKAEHAAPSDYVDVSLLDIDNTLGVCKPGDVLECARLLSRSKPDGRLVPVLKDVPAGFYLRVVYTSTGEHPVEFDFAVESVREVV